MLSNNNYLLSESVLLDFDDKPRKSTVLYSVDHKNIIPFNLYCLVTLGLQAQLDLSRSILLPILCQIIPGYKLSNLRFAK